MHYCKGGGEFFFHSVGHPTSFHSNNHDIIDKRANNWAVDSSFSNENAMINMDSAETESLKEER